MRFKSQTLRNKKINFKRRSNFKIKINKHFYGTAALITQRTARIEGVYVKKLRWKLKKHILRKKKQSRPKKSRTAIWVRYTPNTALSKKSKNARMGSGKGKHVRQVYTAKALSTLFELKAGDYIWCRLLTKYVLRKWNVRLMLKVSKTQPLYRKLHIYSNLLIR